MATNYVVTGKGGPTARKFFNELVRTFPFESYPNGNCGFQDRMSWVFLAAGYSRIGGHGGNPATVAVGVFEHRGTINRKKAAQAILNHQSTPEYRLPKRTIELLSKLI